MDRDKSEKSEKLDRADNGRDHRNRMRVSKACGRCRAQKIKCSGTYPCTSCVKQHKDCVYNTTAATSSRDTIPTPSIINVPEKELPYLSKSDDKVYIKHLENRIQYLESRLSESGETLYESARDGENELEDTARFLSPLTKWRYSNRLQISLTEELSKRIYDTLTPENQAQVQLPRAQYFGWNLSGTHYLKNEQLPELPNVELPEPIDFYIDYFFRELNQLFAIIHEPVFRQQYSSYKEMTEKSQKTSQAKLFEAMLYMIVSLSIRFTEFQKKKDLLLRVLEEEERLFWYCHRIVEILSFQWESFELIQCWLLITLYLRVTHRQTSYFFALGSAVTMARSMGIYKNISKIRQPGTAYEQIKANRVFCALYTIERLFGLQLGRYGFIDQRDIEIELPDRDFDVSADSWITFPALAMLQIAKLANFVHTSRKEKLDLLKYQQINKDLVQLNTWLNERGFHTNELFNNPNEKISSLVRAQVKLHYYDLILCVHGKVLFNFIGSRIATPGLKIEMVLDASQGIIEVLSKVEKANYLYTPWYMSLLLLFHTGMNLLVLINAGLYLPKVRKLYLQTIELINVLKKANVRLPDNRILIKKRFKMAEECIWALKNAGKAISLRFQQDIQQLMTIGLEPGSSEVNRATFNQYGFASETPDEFNVLMRTGKRVKLEKSQETQDDDRMQPPLEPLVSNMIPSQLPTSEPPVLGELSNEINPNDPSYIQPDEGIYHNLLWFDKWIEEGENEWLGQY